MSYEINTALSIVLKICYLIYKMYFLYVLSFIPSWLLYKGVYGVFHSQAYVRPCPGGYRRLCIATGIELKILSILFLAAGIFMCYKIIKGAVTVDLGRIKNNKDKTPANKLYIKHIIICVISMLIFLPLIIFLNIDGAW